MNSTHDAWIEVNVSALASNLKAVKSIIGRSRLMAVVKANAYGHGLVECSRIMVDAGADALAVTRLDEAKQLRAAGIVAPILAFGSIQPDAAPEAVDLDVDITVCTEDLISELNKAAVVAGKKARVHLKVDTGMGRLGVLPADALKYAQFIASSDGLIFAGIYTHFANSIAADIAHTKTQLSSFLSAVEEIRGAGIDCGLVHAANSGAILRLPESHLDMVRPGTILYGQYPSPNVPRSISLENSWQLKAKVSFVKDVPTGHGIGYGSEYVTKKNTKIAIIPLGWADGLTVVPESVARRGVLRTIVSNIQKKPLLIVTIRGKKAPVIGRIAMQMCSVDVSHIPDVEVADEVIIPARRINTSPLLPRVYK